MSRYAGSYTKLAEFGKELLVKNSLEEGLPHISKYAKDIIGADRCSVFIYNEAQDELWTTIADGVDKIVIDSKSGLVGKTIETEESVVENDPYSNPLFATEVDRTTGYKTDSVITAPIFNSSRDIIGVLQLLNKEGGFDDEDVKFMAFFTHYISGFLELTSLYD